MYRSQRASRYVLQPVYVDYSNDLMCFYVINLDQRSISHPISFSNATLNTIIPSALRLQSSVYDIIGIILHYHRIRLY